MIKLLGFDLDDTLLNSKKEIQDKDALKEVIDKGMKICFCSGRPYVKRIKDYYHDIGLDKDLYYVAFNGVSIYKVDTDELVYANALNEDDVTYICDVVNEKINKYFKEEDFAIYSYKMDNSVTSNRLNEYVLLEEKFNNTKINIGNFWECPDKCHKIMISGDPARVNELFSYINNELNDKYEVLISMPFFIEVYQKNNDKYQSLVRVAKEYNIKENEIMTFGDSMNDYTLVKNGEIGIAMGNSVQEVKDASTYVTDTNDNYGVTKALEKYGLIKKRSNHN